MCEAADDDSFVKQPGRRSVVAPASRRFSGGDVADVPQTAIGRALRPLVERLFRAGITANQVTVTSLIGSVAIGLLLSVRGNRSALFGLLPVWLAARMILAAVDGTLAIYIGQNSRLGGFLNDAGDMLSDVALFVPLAFVASFQPCWVALVIALTALCEVVGIVAGTMRGGSRRLDGPFGKADRSLALGAIGLWIACNGSPPAGGVLLPGFTILLLITIINRVRFGTAEIRHLRATCLPSPLAADDT